MTRFMKLGLVTMLIVALTAVAVPTPCAAGDIGGGSDGAAITVGLLVAVIGVLLVIGMVSDIDYFTEKDMPQKLAGLSPADLALPLEKSSIYRDAILEPMEDTSSRATLECSANGLSIRF